jgi:uncharacterized membrane protein
MDAGEVLIPIVMFLVIFGIVYLYYSSRNKERLALIEKGAEASIFYGPKSEKSGKWILKVGVLSIGVALGVLVGAALENAGMDDDVAYPASIFLFAGIALVAAYFLSQKVNGNK